MTTSRCSVIFVCRLLYHARALADIIILCLANFLYGNYKQALDILTNGNDVLPNAMRDLGVTDVSIFESWLEEEKAYLKGLTREPEEETLQMEYWQRLVSLGASK